MSDILSVKYTDERVIVKGVAVYGAVFSHEFFLWIHC